MRALPPTSHAAAWLVLDLGYAANVGSVAILSGDNVTAGLAARSYVTRDIDDELTDALACNADARQLQPGAWSVGGCNKPGRRAACRPPRLLRPAPTASYCAAPWAAHRVAHGSGPLGRAFAPHAQALKLHTPVEQCCI